MSTNNIPVRVIRKRQVREMTGLGLSTISAKVAAGTFPEPIHISEKCVGWLQHEVQAWISARIEESRRGSAS